MRGLALIGIEFCLRRVPGKQPGSHKGTTQDTGDRPQSGKHHQKTIGKVRLMRGLAYFCTVSAAAYALAGMGFGIVMAASHDHTLMTVHAHLNLLGWVSMAIYGLFYHTVPAAAETRLARLHVGVATLGLWIMIPGVAMAVLGMTEGPAIIGSLLTILGMLLFATRVATARRAVA
jgi:hypothetical protein